MGTTYDTAMEIKEQSDEKNTFEQTPFWKMQYTQKKTHTQKWPNIDYGVLLKLPCPPLP